MQKYLRFYNTTSQPLLVDMSDFSFAQGTPDVGTGYVGIRFVSYNGRMFFTILLGTSLSVCHGQSFVTEINKVIERAAGEGWHKVVYDVGVGVGNNPSLPPYTKGTIIWSTPPYCTPWSNTFLGPPNTFNMQEAFVL